MATETNNTDENRTLVVFKPDQGGNEYQVILDSAADAIINLVRK